MPVPDIEESVVKHYLHQLEVNKSPCPGGYHPKFLVESADQICKPLTKIFKDSLRNGVIPYQRRHARISAILKGIKSWRVITDPLASQELFVEC